MINHNPKQETFSASCCFAIRSFAESASSGSWSFLLLECALASVRSPSDRGQGNPQALAAISSGGC